MPSGLIALLDDVATIAKLAAASVDDIGAAVGKAGTKAAGVVILVALAGVGIFLTLEGAPALTAPESSMGGKDNIILYVWPLLYGTLLAAVLAMLIATPLAFGVALVISHYAPRRLSKPVRMWHKARKNRELTS